MDIYEVISERRSVRKYKSDPVPAEQLTRLLDAARQAPSWKNLQCWKLLVVSDPAVRAALADSMPESNPARRAIGETAPLVVVLCANPTQSGMQDNKEYYLLDAGLAMHQLVLAAHAEGLGTCWVALFDEEVARAACAVPPEYRVVAMSPLGTPEKIPSPRPRNNLDEIVYGDKWGQPLEI